MGVWFDIYYVEHNASPTLSCRRSTIMCCVRSQTCEKYVETRAKEMGLDSRHRQYTSTIILFLSLILVLNNPVESQIVF